MHYDRARTSKRMSREVGGQLEEFLMPLLSQLNAVLDKRLVRTFFGLVEAILTHIVCTDCYSVSWEAIY